MADAPSIDFGAIAGKLIKGVVSGENAGDVAKTLLNAEGERVCFEGAIQRLYNARWKIYAGTTASVMGLIVLGSFLRQTTK